jgi:phosphoribosylformimino-5-aminoimidazole carboxamide ribotide isomerase
MQIWPAIDIRGGKCVRLRQGDYQRETVFGDDPPAMARHWVDAGASRLHLVDLDGARGGQVVNWASAEAIMRAVTVPCQWGGGVRDEQTLARLLGLGIERVVLGTSALQRPDWFRAMCGQFPGRVALGIDARGGRVATSGWLETSERRAIDLAKTFAGEPLAAIIYTDIESDGMLAGPNFAALQEMAASVEVPVIASGGVTSAADVSRLATLGLGGAIIGRALYEGTLKLADALAAAGRDDS